MMHANGRNAPGKGHRLRTGRTHQQRANQAGPGGIGDRVDLRGFTPGLIQHLADERQHAFDVITRGQLRNHATVHAVQVDLTEQRIGQQPLLTVVERDTGFVARSFQPQHQHGLQPLQRSE